MADSSLGLLFKIDAESGAARKEIAEFRSHLTRNFSAMRQSVNDFGSQMQATGAKMTAALTLPLVGLGIAAVKSAAEMESLKSGLRAVAGSSEETEKQLVRLKEVAKLPGLGLKEAIRGSIQLQSVKLSAELAERSLMAFGNALATVGKGKAELDGVTLALTQIVSKGKVSAEEINQIAERVPQIREAMKAAFGTADTEKLQKMNLTSEKFIEGVVTQLEKLPRVLGGTLTMLENFADTIDSALVTIGNAILPFVSQIINAVAPAIERFSASFAALTPGTQAAAVAFAAVVAAAGPLIAIIGTLIVAISSVGAPFAAAALAITAAAAALAAAYTSNFLGIRDITNRVLGEVSQFVEQHLGRVRAFFTENMPIIRQAVATVLTAIEGFWKANGANITATVSAAWDAIKTVITAGGDVAMNVIKLVAQVINKDWSGAWSSVVAIVRAAVGGAVAVLGSLRSLAVAAIVATLNNIGTVISGLKSYMVSLGVAIVQGLIDGIKNKAAEAVSAARALAENIITVSRAALLIRSPSGVFFQIGQQVVAGFVGGVESGKAQVAAILRDLVSPSGVRLNKPTRAQSSRAAALAESGATASTAAETDAARSAFEARTIADEEYTRRMVAAENRLQIARLNSIATERAEAVATIKNKNDLALKLEELRQQEAGLVTAHRARIEGINREARERERAATIEHERTLEEIRQIREGRLIERLKLELDGGFITQEEYERKIAELEQAGFDRRRTALERELEAKRANLIESQRIKDELLKLDEQRAASAEAAATRIITASQTNPDNLMLPPGAQPLPGMPTAPGMPKPEDAPKPEDLAKPDTFHEGIRAAWDKTESMVSAAGKKMAQGAGQLLQNWILLGNNGPNALRKMTAAILAAFAAEAAVAALMETARGFAALARAFFGDPRAGAEATAHFASAAVFAGVAGVAAIAGRSLAGNLFQNDARGANGAPNDSRLAAGDRQGGNGGGGTDANGNREPIIIERQREVVYVPHYIRTEPGIIVDRVVEDFRNNGRMRNMILNGEPA